MHKFETPRAGGFTLIELVVVITILGILAAFAIPRFASLEREARMASMGWLRSMRAISSPGTRPATSAGEPGTIETTTGADMAAPG